MQFTLEHPVGRTLTVQTAESVSWQDDEYHITEWVIDVVDLATNESVFHDSSYGSPPYDEHNVDSIRSWLECSGELGSERAHAALNAKRILLEAEQLTVLQKLADGKAKVIELLKVANSVGPLLLVEFANEAPFHAPGTLSSLVSQAQTLRYTQYELARLVKETASIEARMEALLVDAE